MDLIILAWVIFVVVIFAIFIFNFILVRYLSDKRLDRDRDESRDKWVPLIITTIGLSLTMLCVFLIPVDIYSVSGDLSSNTRSTVADAVKVLYYVLYSAIVVFIFIVIPFTYFFYEEYGVDVKLKSRIWAGIKYTSFFIILVLIVFVVGLLVKGGTPTTNESYKEYIENVIDSENSGDSAMVLGIATATALGFLFWITYTAYGLSVFPLGWMKGNKGFRDEKDTLESDLAEARARKKEINSKYLSGNKMSSKDQSTLSLLKRKEEMLEHRKEKLESTRKGLNNVWRCLVPFRFILGFILFLITVLIIVSFILTNIDRIVNSPCGVSCGYVLNDPKKWNPLDTLLVIFSKYFPLDYVVLALIVLYVYFASIAGLINIGIRLLWFRLWKIRPRGTLPQGLLLGTVVLMFTLLALNIELMTLAPQYVAYGSQKYTDSTGNSVSCDLKSPVDLCKMTQIGTIINRISLKLAFFGVIYYYATWVFVACFVIGFIIALVKRRTSNLSGVDNDSESEDFDF